MKLLGVLFATVALCAGHAIPAAPESALDEAYSQTPGDNSHYVDGKSRYIWFPDGDGVPHLVDLLQTPEEDMLRNRNGANNQYWLFTRQNRNIAQILTNGNANSVANSNYDASRPLKVVVHGWNSNGNSLASLRTAFLDASDCNVIVLDWRDVASSNYVSAVLGVPSVGQFLGNFLNWLISTAGGNWNNVHLVGASLGAHVVGNAGRAAGSRAARVTGLDPAGPLWPGNSGALQNNDGQYVEAIHTDGGRLGINNPIGKANFYPNGGRHPQLGCMDSNCSHSRAVYLFDATVRFNNLVGRKCDNLIQANQNRCTGRNFNMGNNILSKQGAVPSVGQFLGNFLSWLISNHGGNWNNVHLVGFSLGAHVVGNAGRTAGRQARRITGLDPAGPQWGNNNNALNSNDGQYVEAIHTDGGLLGINDPIGRTNFYPNGGRNAQPGCLISTCSHSRAYEFFAATVRFNHLIGRQCTNQSQANSNQCTGGNLHMGNAVLNKNGNGLFAMTTGRSWPF